MKSGDQPKALALDFAAYYLVGGGRRALRSYRSNSIGGRLKRVGTKTQISLAMEPGDGHSRVAWGIRSTFHDPHDPIVNSSLPETVERQLAGTATLSPVDENLADQGVDLAALFAATRDSMRARRGVIVSGGWGATGRLNNSQLSTDSLTTIRHSVWLAWQFTLGPRFDLLTSAHWREAFRSDSFGWLGAGLLRKSSLADVLLELHYDSANRRLMPGLGADIRAASRISVMASISGQSPISAPRSEPRLRALALIRWYFAHR